MSELSGVRLNGILLYKYRRLSFLGPRRTFFDIMFKSVDTSDRFHLISEGNLFHIRGPMYDIPFWPMLLARSGIFSLCFDLRIFCL